MSEFDLLHMAAQNFSDNVTTKDEFVCDVKVACGTSPLTTRLPEFGYETLQEIATELLK